MVSCNSNVTTTYHISTNKHPGASVTFWLKQGYLLEGWCLIKGHILRKCSNRTKIYMHIEGVGKHVEIETTGMGKKIFSCTDSAVVKVEKVVSKVAIGTSFH